MPEEDAPFLLPRPRSLAHPEGVGNGLWELTLGHIRGPRRPRGTPKWQALMTRAGSSPLWAPRQAEVEAVEGGLKSEELRSQGQVQPKDNSSPLPALEAQS